MRRLLVTAVLAALVPVPAALPGAEAGQGPSDPRSTELLDYDCSSELSRRRVTLFANGTVRLRESTAERETVRLSELGPEELQAVVRRLQGEELGETPGDLGVVGGEWVEECRLQLRLPGEEPRSFAFDRYSALSLALSRVVAIARELGEQVEEVSLSERHLPGDYSPRPGDVLERLDGALYRVVGRTADGRGVELAGVEQPFTLFVRVEDLGREFVAVASRRHEP